MLGAPSVRVLLDVLVFRRAPAGWRDDDLAFVRDWGFPLGGRGAGAPVTIWQGGQDRMVPYAHGAWLAGHLPGARAHLLPGEGHLTLAVTAFGQILADLLDLADLPPAGCGSQTTRSVDKSTSI